MPQTIFLHHCRWLLMLSLALLLTRPVAHAQVTDFDQMPRCYANTKQAPSPVNIADFKYPPLTSYRGQKVYKISDAKVGKVPFRLHIPPNYDPAKPVPLILLLHGAVGASHFSDALHPDVKNEATDDPFYNKLCQSGYLVIMPYGDRDKGFNWAANKYGATENFTFDALISIINAVKKVVNIDDNKVFAFGHSDGADGAFALDVYRPTLFAGFVSYNSMLANLFVHDFYIHNAVNRPLYLVHSDKDDLRPIQQARVIVQYLDSLKAPVQYHEYLGYKHFDLHLDKDFTSALTFVNTAKRNPYPQSVYWETGNRLNNSCDWLEVDDWGLKLPIAAWAEPNDIRFYNKTTHARMNIKYYDNGPAAAVKGTFKNNVFDLQTSRIKQFKVLISPQMVDLTQNVKIVVNGKLKHDAKITPDDSFFANRFKADHDRKAIWVNAITIVCD
ncbi:alpha/beta hydrolase-fold protein [Mucilaginibacter sp. CSA2-8R]|uniref:alpha/beta hydrolase-fold protein n=1 Tax=Mucilaginibacter sp. CSA2-8R TaxID=3141542 RepID=UPI00315DD7DD